MEDVDQWMLETWRVARLGNAALTSKPLAPHSPDIRAPLALLISSNARRPQEYEYRIAVYYTLVP